MVKEADGKHLVLDGQQRLRTLQAFYAGIFQGKEYLLEHVQDKWKGKAYKTLDADDRRRLDDSIIHATIIRQDEPTEDQSSVYLIFERLNSGGTFLQPQEIRVALYHGGLATLLSKLNENADWRTLYGKKSARLKDLELILRFFAMHYHSASYRRPMKEFLNRYMAANRALARQPEAELVALFHDTVAAIKTHIGERAFRLERAVNAAVLDAVMVGVATRLKQGRVADPGQFAIAYRNLLADSDFVQASVRATADEENVKVRLAKSRAAFSTVK
jgi:molybdopterin converting factor small subunit